MKVHALTRSASRNGVGKGEWRIKGKSFLLDIAVMGSRSTSRKNGEGLGLNEVSGKSSRFRRRTSGITKSPSEGEIRIEKGRGKVSFRSGKVKNPSYLVGLNPRRPLFSIVKGGGG